MIEVTVSSIVVALALPVVVMNPVSNAALSTLCQKVSLSQVSSTLGVKATKITPEYNGNVTVCWFRVGANADAVYVRRQTGVNVGVYNLNKATAKTQGEKPIADKHFAPFGAYSTSIGSATYGYTNAVTILKKSTEIDVGAVNVKLIKVESLAKKVLPLS
jgi:hypothetical protein